MKVIHIPNLFERQKKTVHEIEFDSLDLNALFKKVKGRKRLKKEDYIAIVSGKVFKSEEWKYVPTKHDEITFVNDMKGKVLGFIVGALTLIAGIALTIAHNPAGVALVS